MKRSSTTRLLSVALGLAALLPGFAPGVAVAEGAEELHAPFGEKPVATGVYAASGTNLLVRVGDDRFLSTVDNGQTWQTAAVNPVQEQLYTESVEGSKAVFTDYSHSVSVFDLAANTKASYNVDYGDVVASSPTTAVVLVNDYYHPYVAISLTGGNVKPLTMQELRYPSGWEYNSEDDWADYVMVSSGRAIWIQDFSEGGRPIATDIDPVPLDGTQGGTPFRVSGVVPYVGIVGDRIEYVKKASYDVVLCSRDFSGLNETCTKIAKLSSSAHSVAADRAGEVIRLRLNGVPYIWEGGILSKVAFSGTSALFHAMGDPSRPLMGIQDSSGGGIYQVMGGGSTQLLFGNLGEPVDPSSIDIAPARMVGISSDFAWSRPVDPTTIGRESRLGAAATAAATAGRVVTLGTKGLVFYDQGSFAATGPTASQLVAASGPYVLVKANGVNAIRTHAGPVNASGPLALFGSRYVARGSDVNGVPQLTVRDVSDPGFQPITFPLPAGISSWSPEGTRIWGDWVAVRVFVGTRADIHVYNYATGAWGEEFVDAWPIEDMGDGVAVLRDRGNQDRVTVWNFLTGERTALGAARDVALDDGNRMAYFDEDELIVRVVDGMGASAPRLLGTVAPASFNPNAGAWSAQFDATKALSAGTLEIGHGTGEDAVVDRVLEVPASADGSIRGVAWDGRSDAGEWVADGAYTWTLKTADATDAGKPLVAVDGTSAASGKVTVKTANLGTATGPTPKVSDTTPTVDQTLTAVTGTWAPSSVQFAFQWYRGTSAIPGATSQTYTVGASDAGQALKVKVTGSCPGTESFCRGYATASKTSAATSTVAKATITPAPVPTLDATSAVVDTPITATTGVWGPDPVTLSFQWYKVNSKGTSSAIKGATSTTFTPTGAEVGYKLKLKVTGTKPGYTTKGVYSALTGKVATANFTSVADPTVTGSVKVGMPLTAVPGASDPAASYSYQWYRGTSTISGATAATYRTTSTDLGKQIRVRVTYKRSGYVSVSRYSAFTGAIEPGIIAVTPKLDDTTPVVGQVLKITDATSIGSWNPSDATAAYQWYRDTTAIPGATEATYEVQSADVGKAIKVKVTGSKDGYASVAKTSAASSDVAKGTFTTKPVPTIEGELTVGSTLTAVHGDWSPAPTSFTYAWYRSGTAITGQAASTYTVVAADAGRTITVKVTAVRSGFTSASATSAGVLIPA